MPTTAPDPRALGRQRLAALRRRARRIRLTVTSLAVALFLAAFAGISVQLATGHDPVLKPTRASAVASPAAAPPTVAATGPSVTGSSAAASPASAAVPAPVSTQQS